MNIQSFLCIIIFISFLYFGVYIIKKDYKNNISRLFFLLCLCLSLASLFAGITFSSDNKEDAFFWYKIAVSFVFFYISFNLHFNLTLTGKKIKTAYQAIIHFPPVLFTILTFTSTTCYSGCFKYNDIWIFTISPNSIGFLLYLIFIVSYTVPVIIVLIDWKRRAKKQRLKKQARLILTVYCASIAINFFLDIIVPSLKIYLLAVLGPAGAFIYIAGLWYSMVRYKFLVFQPSMAANNIISNIQEMVILLNPEFKIINQNNKCAELLQYNPEEFADKYYSDLVTESGYLTKELNKLTEKKLNSFNDKIIYKTGIGNIITDTYFAGIMDEFEDIIGILVISRENKGLKEFQRKYKFTQRQLEVIILSVSGLSNPEIGQRLSLAERTIETHFFNIYHKLDINNKIELLNISREYNVI